MAGVIPTFTIDQSAFTLLGENLYEGRLAAIWARETLQNAIDAGAKNVKITFRQGMFPEGSANFDFSLPCFYEYQGRETTVILTCEDDGIGMDEEILLDAFLKLGGSYKVDSDVVGGFGVAKAIILCGQRWSVETNDLHLDSSMMGNEPIRTVEIPRDGTLVEMGIITRNCHRWSFDDLRTCLVLSHVPGVRIRLVRLNVRGDEISDEIIRGIRAGKQIDDLGWSILSTNQAKGSTYRGIHVRARGLYQFTDYLSHDTCAFLDIPHLPRVGDVAYPLTVSRESLKTERRSEVEGLIQRMVVEPTKVRGRDVDEETLTKFGVHRPLRVPDHPESVPFQKIALGIPGTSVVDVLPPTKAWNVASVDVRRESEESPLEFPFLVLRHRKHRTSRPEKTRKGLRMLNVWHSLVSEVMKILGSSHTLDEGLQVGLVLKDRVSAMYYRDDDVRGILLNPKGLRLGDPMKTLIPRMLYRLVEELLHAGGRDVHDETLHYEVFSAFDLLMRDHYQRLEDSVDVGMRSPVVRHPTSLAPM